MQFSEYTDVAIRVLMYLSLNDPNYSKVDAISKSCNTSRAQVVKATQMLRAAKLISSQIGRGGGFRLARPAKDISIGSVIRLSEGRFLMAECLQPGQSTNCPIAPVCRMRCIFQDALQDMLKRFDRYTLGDITSNADELRSLCLN